MENKRYENSVLFGPIITWAFLPALIFIIGEIWVLSKSTSDWVISVIIGVIVCGTIFYFFSLKMYYLNRPKYIEISDDGVNLIMRMGKRPIFMTWQKVLIIGSQTFISGKVDGIIRDDITMYYPIDYSLSLELRNEYRQRMGHYPPERFNDLCPGMEQDILALDTRQFNKKYERFMKK